MAYPSSESALVHHVAKEAFIAALDDSTLQLKVMEREPKTVEDALRCVDDLEDGRNRRRPKKVCAVGDGSDAREVLSLRQQVPQLQDALFQTTQRLEALAADTERNRVEPAKILPSDAGTHLDTGSVATTGVASHPPLTSGSGRGNGRGRGVRRQARDADICRACGEAGHWAKDCKKRLDAPTVKGVVCQRPASTRVYVMAQFRGRPIRCLLNSGCDRSVIGRCYVGDARLRSSTYELLVCVGGDVKHCSLTQSVLQF